MSFCLNQIIIIAHKEMHEAQQKLEVEESGREVASLVGRVAGYKKLVSIIAEKFAISRAYLGVMEDTRDMPFNLKELTDEGLSEAFCDMGSLRVSEDWIGVLAEIGTLVEGMKSYLLFDAEKSRDLDIAQGKYKAMTLYNGFFTDIESEVKNREREAERKRKERAASLPFDPTEVSFGQPEEVAAEAGV